MTKESNKSYNIDSLGASRGKENVGDVWLGTLINPNGVSAELRICHV